MVARDVYVPTVKPRRREGILAFAERIARSFAPVIFSSPQPFPVLQFFDGGGLQDIDSTLEVGVENLPAGIEGLTTPAGQVLIAEEVYLAAERGDGRARFTIAHECGHALLHYREIQRKLVDRRSMVLRRRRSIPAFRDPEWQANVFAAGLLMPTSLVQEILRRPVRNPYLMDKIDVVAHAFGVSRTAAEIRVEQVLETTTARRSGGSSGPFRAP